MRYPNGRDLPLHITHMLKTLARPHHFHNIILTPLRFKYLYQARKVSDRAFCVLVISIFSKNFLLHFGNILTVWYFCCSFYFNKYHGLLVVRYFVGGGNRNTRKNSHIKLF